MDGQPVQDMFAFEPVSSAWQSTQADDFSFTGNDNDTQDSWAEFMSWDPETSEAPASSLLYDANSGASEQLDQKMAMDSKPGQFALSLNAEEYAESMGMGDPPSGFPFGADSDGSPVFDFQFSALEPTPDVPGFLRTPETKGSLRDGSLDLSPAAVSGPEISGNMLSGSSVSSRNSIDQSSPSDAHGTPPSSEGSPEPRANHGRKRKSTEDTGENAETGKPGKRGARQLPPKKTSHNMIEKRYRNKLNDKIEELKRSVPSLKKLSSAGLADDNDEDDLDGLTPAHKTNKATVLAKATEYIRHLEKRNKQLNDDMQAMKTEMEKVKKFARSATMQFNNGLSTSDNPRFAGGQLPPLSGSATPDNTDPVQGMIPVPESIMNLHGSAAGQQHYAHRYSSYPNAPRQPAAQQPMTRMRAGQPLNKLMVGALAGLMIFEGFNEREESGENTEGRGLFAIPIQLLGRLPWFQLQYSAPQGGSISLMPLLKAFLLMGALVYLIAPLFDFKPKSKKQLAAARLNMTPALASPIEVRRNAWLTALQSVWVPDNFFFSGLAAITLKAAEVSARSVIGHEGYAVLTDTTKEQEQARVNAWETAIDAQLTGGDAEISISRLVLTVLASGTLPDTPARLMLKSLHCRVLLWEVVKTGYGDWFHIDKMCARWARKYWNAARDQQLSITDSKTKDGTGSDIDPEPLPGHLAALLELECDDVLIDSITQRAYNLAWNRVGDHDDNMDGVLEDFGISNPLDALAAWHSSYTTKEALSSSLSTTAVASSARIVKEIDLAVRVAPPASTAYVRALVARTILVEEGREANIASTMKALPLNPNRANVLENAVTTAPITRDVKVALTLAKCLSLLQAHPTNAAAKAVAINAISTPRFPNSSWTLLSFAAAYKVMNAFACDKSFLRERKPAQRTVEKLAGELRLWIGKTDGEKLALGKTRGRVIQRCLLVRKEVGGLGEEEERESGYGSAED